MSVAWHSPLVDRSSARLRRARVALSSGRPADALAALGPARERGAGALVRIDALATLGRESEALAAASRALHAGPLAPDLGARLRVARAEALIEQGRVVAAEADLRVARTLAGEPRTLVRLRLAEARALWRRGEPVAAAESLRQARELCGQERWSAALARVHAQEAQLARDAGRLRESQQALCRRLELARVIGREDALASALADRGELEAYLGGWREAAGDLEQAAEIWRRLGDPRAASVAGLRLASVRLAQGDLAAARSEADRARSQARSAPGRLRAEVLLLEADLTLAAGQPAVSEADSEEAARLFEQIHDRDGESRARARRSQALLARGALAEALREAERALRLGRRRPDLVVLAEIARGRALRHAGQPAEAAFERALAAAQARPGLHAVAALGLCLCRGEAVHSEAVTNALEAIAAWGDRRILAYARADLGLGADGGGERPTALDSATAAAGPTHRLLGRCDALRALLDRLPRYARAASDVHVVGETGTGKEQIALALHALSGRRGAFVAVSAADLQNETLDSILFGHVRGAYTGATSDRPGLVVEAEAGTLFLDEVQDLSPRTQGALLRFLQERQYRRLGESAVRTADVRVVTASNVPLALKVARGELRADVMHRLHQLVLELPPLRERGDDVLLLARAFLKRLAAQDGRGCPELSAAAAEALRAHAWPGNVRELMNAMRQALVDCSGPSLLPDHLPPGVRGGQLGDGASLPERVARFERAAIDEALARSGGNRAQAARVLGLTRQGLAQKLRRLGR